MANEKDPSTNAYEADPLEKSGNGDTRRSAARAWTERLSPRNRNLIIAGAAIILAVALALIIWPSGDSARQGNQQTGEAGPLGEHEGEGNEVELSEEAMAAAGIEIVAVSERPAVSLLRVPGTVEANQQKVQQVTPLVSGRVERVHAVIGDRVRAGAVLAVISSPQIAEMHGKLHEAETALSVAERNYARVQQAENRAAVLQAKARLDEAEANLRRTRRLIELGAGAGKDLIAAETAYKTANAEYEFQSNIALNRELAEARAAVDTTKVDVAHIRDQLSALGAPVSEGEEDQRRHDTSLISLRAPVSGTVTERMTNAGAGIEAGNPLFTIADISTLWVIANAPESQIGLLRVGTSAEVRAAAPGVDAISGSVTYIDPILNEETRTARVRIEVANPGERLKVGMFVEVGFATVADDDSAAVELMVPEESIQRIGDRTVVFIPKEGEPGHFEARDVELGVVVDGYHRVINGLASGDRIVTKGSFTLKTQLLKGEMGEHGH
ncbi:MAG: efflux RND transporter periplasmic adaptor subunit [Blastocatellia bacterium]|nr:efflux RND transporter periplasmic adaptor subunit [Blastocatellia bacterium]